MAAKNVPVLPPEVAPGQQVTEALKAGLYLIKGTSIAGSDAAAAYEVLQLPPNCYVKEILLDVTTAFDATGTNLKVGDSDDDDRYFTATLAAAHVVGSRSSAGNSASAAAGAGGKFYASSDGRAIIGTVTKGATSNAATLGTIDVYALVSFYSDLL